VRDQLVFVSYSRRDKDVIAPLVDLLRATGQSVFRDTDHIPAGSRWRMVLTDAIDRCRTLLLFWCHHSAGSAEVEKEYRQALTQNKIVVPVLIDPTELTDELAELQAIDLSRILGAHEERIVEVPILTRGMWNKHKAPRCREVHVQVPEAERMQQAALTLFESLGRRWDADASA
jgi:hypothetical protein